MLKKINPKSEVSGREIFLTQSNKLIYVIFTYTRKSHALEIYHIFY
jgi:hypothetical protein